MSREVFMELTNTFKFVNDDLNHKFITLVKKSRIEHAIDNDGVVHYSPEDEESVEADLIDPVRDQVFPSWQVVTCPGDWVEVYKQYMEGHAIPFSEELGNHQLWFLIPKKYRPHTWKLG